MERACAIIFIFLINFILGFSETDIYNNDFERNDKRTEERVVKDFPDKTYNLMCMASHNALRVAVGLGELQWNGELGTMAEVEASKMMLQEQTNMDLSFLNNNDIVFNQAGLTLSLSRIMDHNQMEVYLSKQVDSVIRQWYMDGLFNGEEQDEYERMMSPMATDIGCSLRAYAQNSTSLRAFIAVAYSSNNPMPNTERSEYFDGSYPLKEMALDQGRMCVSNCTFGQVCYSHKQGIESIAPRAIVKGRYSGYVDEEYCVCEEDTELPSEHGEASKPACEGPCFVNCPFGRSEDEESSCFGMSFCTCSYRYGGAFCL